MRSCVLSVIRGCVVLLATTSVHAELRSYELRAGPPPACGEVSGSFKPQTDPGKLKVGVAVPSDAQAKLELIVHSGDKPTMKVDGTQKPGEKSIQVGVDTPPDKGAKFDVILVLGDKRVACVEGQGFDRSRDTPKPEANPGARGELTEKDLRALAWLHRPETGNKRLRELAGALQASSTQPLVHLPSGAVASIAFGAAAPFPESVVEDGKLQVLLVVDRTSPDKAILDVLDCRQPDRFRILGQEVGTKEALRPEEAPFEIVPIGPILKCGAPQMRYRVGQVPSELAERIPETKLRVRPVYQLAATVIWAFDFGKSFSLSTSADHRIVSSGDTVGSSFKVGFVWFPGGLDPENLKKRNFFLNPFLVFDPAAAKDNFATGLAITSGRGVAIAVGVSLSRVTVPKGLSIGDEFKGEGDVPAKKVWNKDSLGLFIGVALDTNAFSKVNGIWKGLTK